MKKVIIILTIIISFNLLANDQLFPFQRVIRVKEIKDKLEVKKAFAASFKFVGEGERFLVVRPVELKKIDDYKNALVKLKSWKRVIKIEKDHLVYPKLDDLVGCPGNCGTQTVDMDDFNAIWDKLIKQANAFRACSDPACRLFPTCSSGVNPAWGKMIIGADLADKMVDDILTKNKSKDFATVAVVDTGFDTSTQKDGMEVARLSIYSGHDDAGDPNTDQDGHGTAVSGMIGGRGIGITEYVNLDVYRVTGAGKSRGVSSAILAQTIEKACAQADVVNVSWGSQEDELGNLKLEDALWYKKAKEKGCLVVKAAGNAGVRAGNHFDIPDDAPFISAASVGQFENESTFSTQGMIAAPGEGVYTNLSSQHNYSDKTKKKSCLLDNKYNVGPVNGTSFAAPAVAGVAGQVITILRARKMLPSDPVLKVQLVKNILLASTMLPKGRESEDRVVNAIGAALIASKIDKTDFSASAKILSDIPAGDELCDSFTQCPTDECQKAKDCINRLRSANFICSTPYADLKIGAPYGAKEYQTSKNYRQRMQGLFAGLQCMKEKTLAISLIATAPYGVLAKDSASEFCQELWSENYTAKKAPKDLKRGVDILEAVDSLGVPFVNYDRVVELMKPWDFQWTFRIESDLGEDVWKGGEEEIFKRFLNVFRSLSVSDQLKLIKLIPRNSSRYMDSSGEMGLLYLLYRYGDRLSKEVQDAVKMRLQQLAASWFEESGNDSSKGYDGNLKLYEAFVETTPNGKEIFLSKLNSRLRDENVRFVALSLDSEKFLTEEQRDDFMAKLLSDNKYSSNSNFRSLLNKAFKQRFFSADPDEENREIKNFIINSPLLDLGPTFRLKYLEQNIDRLVGKGGKDLSKIMKDKRMWQRYADVHFKQLENLFDMQEVAFNDGITARNMARNMSDWVFENMYFNFLELAVDKNSVASLLKKSSTVLGRTTNTSSSSSSYGEDYMKDAAINTIISAIEACPAENEALYRDALKDINLEAIKTRSQRETIKKFLKGENWSRVF